MSFASTPPTTWAPGTVVPGTVYRIIRPLGQGGMGEVYEVEHTLLGTRRALKVLAKHFAGREDLAERLRVEARGLARIKHPNLVEVYDLGTSADGRIFFAMELLEGATLRDLLRMQGKLSIAAAVRVIAQVLVGLDVAHSAGMLHRDIKPENLFVCRDGTTKLLDFGVAKAIDASTSSQSLTGVGMTVGTPRYMSPEQAEGDPIDARTDIYSVGLVLWELIAGYSPFEQTDPVALVVAKRDPGVPLLCGTAVDAVPAGLGAALQRACAGDPKLRFLTASEFSKALLDATRSSTDGRSSLRPVPHLETATTIVAPIDLTPRSDSPSWRPRASALEDSTIVDSSVLHPSDGTNDTDPALTDITSRLCVARDAIRDQPTSVPGSPGLAFGPSGTALLPAVAARRHAGASPSPPAVVASPAVSHDAASLASDPQASGSARSTKARKARWTWKGLGAGLLAFIVPVTTALTVGYARCDFATARSAEGQPVAGAVPPQVQPAATIPADTSLPPIAMTDAAAASASSTVVRSPPPPSSARAAASSSAAKRVPPPAKTAGMPRSGL